ncbi:CinA family protein [Denitrificimonas sp. JX-1]|uniref:CinA family protein n=1 Tax=Denitrificimonas halotolerans TaxID=3098930 RepID=A0ABU5GMJ1_9GAMM|nr:CinA family protein [Denitrificimonas sp. JX-1]MDY7218148.1 CinA family protein [Denitrificimonas sp. JX-1]
MLTITQLAEQLGEQLQLHSAAVTTAESCTGGGIAEAITRIAGSSAWFEVGFITYSNAQKERLLQVPAASLEHDGAVSQPVVEAMVRGAQKLSSAKYGVAVSGVAGPGGGSIGKPVGTVWIAWADGEQVESGCWHFSGDRDAVRRQTVQAALAGLLCVIEGQAANTWQCWLKKDLPNP